MAPPPKKEIDPEEILRRKFRAKCQFRALGRLAMANTYWLIEDVDSYEGVEDVKRRVEQAMRGKTKKKKQLLSIKDKALLNKPAHERTDQEKKYIYRIIGGLKCFKKYPSQVKKRLAAVTYFKYYPPGRVIVRQHQEAHALYFIVTGEVIVSQVNFDELLQVNVSVDVGSMHSGDMFGEVSLLHDIPRTATCTSSDHCELLVLMKEDFKNVLQVSVQAQWEVVLRAMSKFTYFNSLDEVALREGCLVAKMKSYEPNETILGDGSGIPNYVYFLLSGQCQMIESIKVTSVTRLGKTFYTLFDPYVEEEESEQDLDTKYFRAYNKKCDSSAMQTQESAIQRKVSIFTPSLAPIQSKGSEINKNVGILASSRQSILKVSNDDPRKRLETPRNSSVIDLDSKTGSRSHLLLKSPSDGKMRNSQRFSSPMISRINLRTSKLPNLKTYFMQVCRFNTGSTFGFGENMRDRRIVALTPIECMLFPKVWLLQRNTANIWTRIQHYLEKKIPTKQQIFAEFVRQRDWVTYKDGKVNEVIARSKTVNWTTPHDVPYSVRMEEMIDI